MKKTEKSNTNEIIEIPAEEAPYALPDGWKWVRLLSTFNNETDSKKKIQTKDYLPNGKIPVIDQGQNLIGGYTNEESFMNLSELPVVIFGDHTRCVKYVDFHFVQGADGIKILKPKSDILPKFLFWGLKNLSIPDLGYRRHFPLFPQFVVPLPPLETQKRIVDRIESLFAKLDEAKEKAQTALDTFELRKSAILHKAFTGQLTAKWREENNAVAVTSENSDNLTSTPTEGPNSSTPVSSEDSNNVTSVPNPLSPKQAYGEPVEQDAGKCNESFLTGSEYYQNLVSSNLRLKKSYSKVEGWTYSALEKVCKTIKYGTSKKSEKSGKVVVLRMGNMKNGGLDWSDLAFTNDEEDIKKYWLIPGDVLFNRTNSSEWVGKVSIYRGEMPSIYAGYIIKLDYDRSILNGEFFNYILNSPEEREYCQAVKTDGVNQANINSKKIGAFVIPIPPLPEQQEIVRILDDLLTKENAAKEAAEAVIEKIDLMKKSILARAFRGEL